MSGPRREVRRGDRSSLDFIKGCHGSLLAPQRDQTVATTCRPGARAIRVSRSPAL